MSIPSTNKYMSIYLTALRTLSKDEKIKTRLSYQHISHGDVQVVLDGLGDVLGTHLLKSIFAVDCPLDLARVLININRVVSVSFDEYDFDAKLVSIQVRRISDKTGKMKYSYTFLIEKDPDELDLQLSMYVKQREQDENGVQKLIDFNMNIEFVKE